MWVGIPTLMLIAIVMVMLNPVLPFSAVHSVSVITAGFLVASNILRTACPGTHDKFLIVIGIVVNGPTIWQPLRITA